MISLLFYFEKNKTNANSIYHVESIVDLVKKAKNGEIFAIFFAARIFS